MKLNILKKGFSLTELLIVLVVVAVLFSAMLPIMTKRDFGATKGFEPVWQFVGDVEQNAYTNHGKNDVNNALFIGNTKPGMSDNWKPYSKLVIKTDNKTQNMLQLRYGQGNGILAALFYMNNGNILTTGKHKLDTENSANTNYENTIYGNGLFATVQHSYRNTFIGSNSTKYGSGKPSSVSPNNVSVGVNTNKYGKSQNSVLLGANIASEDNVTIKDSVVLGANNLVANSSIKEGVLIGNESVVEGTYGYGNTIIGSRYKGGTAQVGYNTLVGVGAFETGDNLAQGITSVGYNTCNTLAAPNGGAQNKTCIGYTSGSGYGNTENMNWESDGAEHIFIGGVPQHSRLGGRAVLEVHNITKDNLEKSGNLHPGGAKPDIAPTVVMNSNLVVRGNTYLTTIDGVLRPMNFAMPAGEKGWENGADFCSSDGWKTDHNQDAGLEHDESKDCGVNNPYFLYVGGPPDFIRWAKALASCKADGRFSSDTSRVRDAKTASAVMYDRGQRCVYNEKQNYPYNGEDGSSLYGNHCPFLHLSDVRLKTDISENTAGIEKLLMVMPYNYTYKADKASKPQVGVIAQDLQKYFPNSVSVDEDGYLSIRWDEMFFATINSVKSLDETLALAEKDVADMENDVIKLANNHRSTKKRIDELNKRINKLEK